MTQQTPTPAPAPAHAAPKTKQRRQSAYCFTLKGKIPLDMTNAASLVEAMGSVAKLKDSLPAGSITTLTADTGKI